MGAPLVPKLFKVEYWPVLPRALTALKHHGEKAFGYTIYCRNQPIIRETATLNFLIDDQQTKVNNNANQGGRYYRN